MKKKINKSKNKKVRNATEMIVDGIHFKSKLEVYCYTQLKENNIKADYEEHKFVLVDKFEFNNESYEVVGKQKEFKPASNNIRSMTYTPDFTDKKLNWIIECKGQKTDTFTLKWKLFKQYLNTNNIEVCLFMPRNQKQINKTIEIIRDKYGR